MTRTLLAALILTTIAMPALADDKLMVMDGWARPTPTVNSAGYMILHNMSDKPVTVTGFTSPAAQKILAHKTVEENGVTKMRALEAVTLQPDEMTTFKPGGNHLMIMNMTRPLAAGTSFPIDVHFADKTVQRIELEATNTPPAE